MLFHELATCVLFKKPTLSAKGITIALWLAACLLILWSEAQIHSAKLPIRVDSC